MTTERDRPGSLGYRVMNARWFWFLGGPRRTYEHENNTPERYPGWPKSFESKIGFRITLICIDLFQNRQRLAVRCMEAQATLSQFIKRDPNTCPHFELCIIEHAEFLGSISELSHGVLSVTQLTRDENQMSRTFLLEDEMRNEPWAQELECLNQDDINRSASK